MAIIKNGILGGFSGKVGTVVGVTWRDIDVMRALARPRTRAVSPAEQLQRAKMATVSSFLQPMRDLLEVGFRDFAKKKDGSNAAQSHVMKNAVMVKGNDVYIMCEEVLVTRGDLPNVKVAVAGSAEKGVIQFAWEDNSGLGKAGRADKAVLVVRRNEPKSCVYTLDGGFRSDGAASIQVNAFSGCEVHTWLSFVSKDRKDITNSIFTGQFVVA